MEKPFLEVFPGLNIADELKELLKLVVVEKVTMTKDRSSIRVYIRSPRLIHKKNIYALEAGIAKQLFRETDHDQDLREIPPLGTVYPGEALRCLPGQYPHGVKELRDDRV